MPTVPVRVSCVSTRCCCCGWGCGGAATRWRGAVAARRGLRRCLVMSTETVGSGVAACPPCAWADRTTASSGMAATSSAATLTAPIFA